MSRNNEVRPHSQTQYQGAAPMAIKKDAYSIIATKEGNQKLKNLEIMLHWIICAYCPCYSTGTMSNVHICTTGGGTCLLQII
jgi:hypothetical protein